MKKILVSMMFCWSICLFSMDDEYAQYIDDANYQLLIDQTLQEKRDIFHKAVWSNDISLAQECIKHKVVNVRQHYWDNILLYAQSKEMVQMLIKAGGNVNKQILARWRPLHNAVFHNNISLVERWLVEGADANLPGFYGLTPLHKVQSKEMVNMLIKFGADVNRVDSNHLTPLHCAQNKEIVQALIQAGADTNRQYRFSDTPLNTAIYNNNINLLKKFIKGGFDINLQGEFGCTLLHLTILYNKIKIIEILIENGADVNVKNLEGNTPLHQAMIINNIPAVKILIEHGADVDVLNNYSHKPFDCGSLQIQETAREYHASLFQRCGVGLK